VRLGNASTWRGAVAALNEEHEDQENEAPLLPEAERHALETALLANVHAQHEALNALLHAVNIGIRRRSRAHLTQFLHSSHFRLAARAASSP
jgi:hypothetical protein